MTLHNLDSHISWLLQSKPTVVSCSAPAHHSTAATATLQGRVPDASTRETNTTHLERQRLRFDPQLDVDNSKRPGHTNPSPDINQAGSLREVARNAEESNMARLASASRKPRPTLLHNQQTPAGAPGTTTPSSIAVAYAASFHKDGMSWVQFFLVFFSDNAQVHLQAHLRGSQRQPFQRLLKRHKPRGRLQDNYPGINHSFRL